MAFTRLAFPAMAAEALYFLLDEKSNKKSSQQRGFFAALGLCPAKLIKPRAA
jgi:hypothetical protein